jgi:hypothetical protein
MRLGLNAEVVNDRAKLLTHRILARQLSVDPDLIERARQIISKQRSVGRSYSFLDEWEQLLNLEPSTLRRLITERSENMARLRISSPLGLASGLFTEDEALRRRILRKAKLGLMLSSKRQAGAESTSMAPAA